MTGPACVEGCGVEVGVSAGVGVRGGEGGGTSGAAGQEDRMEGEGAHRRWWGVKKRQRGVARMHNCRVQHSLAQGGKGLNSVDFYCSGGFGCGDSSALFSVFI